MKKVTIHFLLPLLAGFAGAFLFQYVTDQPDKYFAPQAVHFNRDTSSYIHQVNYRNTSSQATRDVPDDFVQASEASTSSVVYIKTLVQNDLNGATWYDLFFGEGSGKNVSSGSGVIFREDGYIVTNNHVIENAAKIQIMHEKRTYEADVIGTDPSTDIAVLKIEADDLPAIKMGVSKDVKVGEWVLAVGNPFNLTSTVTAGIVSAKARDLNILKGKFPIESFIQTDAAINPGNSGGALVNKRGELVGVNTAILSKTGSYAGYGFAVPSDIVNKVVKDIIEYGEVQKAFMGAEVTDISNQMAKQADLNSLNGVVVAGIQPDGAAENAGLEKGDVIVGMDGEPITGKSIYEEQLSYYSPGEVVAVSYIRNGKENSTKVTLTNKDGKTGIYITKGYSSKFLGAELEPLPKIERDAMNINHGVKVTELHNGFLRKLNINEGFTITHINKIPIKDPETLEDILKKIRGRVIIEGINKKGVRGFYSYYF